jgi:putative addiction module CopG family antidote
MAKEIKATRQAAADSAVERQKHRRLARELANLDPSEEKRMAGESLTVSPPKRAPVVILEWMEVHLTPDQQAFVRQGIASGRYGSAEDAVKEALAAWEEAERVRLELVLALDEAEADLKAGRFADYGNEALPVLAEELKREARAERKREQS